MFLRESPVGFQITGIMMHSMSQRSSSSLLRISKTFPWVLMKHGLERHDENINLKLSYIILNTYLQYFN